MYIFGTFSDKYAQSIVFSVFLYKLYLSSQIAPVRSQTLVEQVRRFYCTEKKEMTSFPIVKIALAFRNSQ